MHLPLSPESSISSRLMKPAVCFQWAALAALTAVVGACSGQSRALPEPPRVAQSQPGTPGGSLVLGVPGMPRTLNPVLDWDGGSDAIIRLLFSSLVGVNMENQQPEPALAESWSVAPDQKTWTFKLRKNLRWSDGQPLTADDVVFTWNDVMYNSNYNQTTYELFRLGGKSFEVSKVDDTTVRVVTPEVFAPFVEYFGSVVILPRHILGPAIARNRFTNAYTLSGNPAQIVGSGPFRFKDYDPGKTVVLEPNPDFWVVDKQNRRLPYFDNVKLVIASTPQAFQMLFTNGTTDAYESVRPEDWPLFQQTAANGRTRLVDLGTGVQRDVVWFNQNTNMDANGKPLVDPVKLKWFRDKRFRQAMSFAVNRDEIIRQVYNGRAQSVQGFLSSDNKQWNNPSVPQYSYDPDKARALLAEIGMTNHAADGTLEDADGHPVKFSILYAYENPVRGKIATMVAADFKRLGIQLDVQPVDFLMLTRQINVFMNYECATLGLGGGGLDPASLMNILKSDAPLHQWFPSQQHPSTEWEANLDLLMDDQLHTLDPAQRKKYFDEAQSIWADEQPMICLAAPYVAAAIRSDIANVRPAMASSYHVTWNVEELYFKK